MPLPEEAMHIAISVTPTSVPARQWVLEGSELLHKMQNRGRYSRSWEEKRNKNR